MRACASSTYNPIGMGACCDRVDTDQPQSDERTCGLLDMDVDDEDDMPAAHKACCYHRPAMQQAVVLAVVPARLMKETAWRCQQAMLNVDPVALMVALRVCGAKSRHVHGGRCSCCRETQIGSKHSHQAHRCTH